MGAVTREVDTVAVADIEPAVDSMVAAVVFTVVVAASTGVAVGTAGEAGIANRRF
jgi:hypothetical protein